MHDSQCKNPRCHQPVDDGFLCSGCTNTARDHLRDLSGDAGIPADRPPDRGLLADLQVLMAREDVADPDTARPVELPDPDDVPRKTDEPIATHAIPVHLGAGKALGEAHRDLRRWVRAIVDTRLRGQLDRDVAAIAAGRRYVVEALELPSRVEGAHLNGYLADRPRRPLYVQLPNADDPRDLALWLGRHTHDLRQHPAAGEIAAGLARHAARAENILSGRDVEYLGLCPHCWEHHDGREVLLYCDRGDRMVFCPRCGSGYDTGELREWLLRRARDQWLPAPEIDRALVDHVRGLRARHELTEHELPWSVDVVKGLGRRGRIARLEPTAAEKAAGSRSQTRYLVGEAMDAIETQARDRRAARDRKGAAAATR